MYKQYAYSTWTTQTFDRYKSVPDHLKIFRRSRCICLTRSRNRKGDFEVA